MGTYRDFKGINFLFHAAAWVCTLRPHGVKFGRNFWFPYTTQTPLATYLARLFNPKYIPKHPRTPDSSFYTILPSLLAQETLWRTKLKVKQGRNSIVFGDFNIIYSFSLVFILLNIFRSRFSYLWINFEIDLTCIKFFIETMFFSIEQLNYVLNLYFIKSIGVIIYFLILHVYERFIIWFQ